ncbi:oxepin-CoA hydrolase, alternative type [Ramlibacter sp. MAHUQ-53]|uniref:oxepin-CoA hydrolase, alternative type n=1 Tax=unclassified Ramlibacter TaxID=2617605 RepID=UPI003645322A
MPAELRSTSEGRTMVLTLSNPEHRNAMGPEIYAAGIEALGVAESAAEVRSVVITGAGAHFSGGGQLQRLQATRRLPADEQTEGIDGLHTWIEAIRTFPKPVIAAVEGACAGGAFSLALACDFVVAAEDAVFVMAHTHIGLSCDGGASWSLMRSLPRQVAAELLMAGERFDAQRLHTLGVVNRVTAPGAAFDQALQLAERLNAKAPNALASFKELMNEATENSLPQQLARERHHFVKNLNHANAGLGIEAMLARTRPAFE